MPSTIAFIVIRAQRRNVVAVSPRQNPIQASTPESLDSRSSFAQTFLDATLAAVLAAVKLKATRELATRILHAAPRCVRVGKYSSTKLGVVSVYLLSPHLRSGSQRCASTLETDSPLGWKCPADLMKCYFAVSPEMRSMSPLRSRGREHGAACMR